MPELPEVETVKNTLKTKLIDNVIKSVDIYYDKIIEYPSVNEFKTQIKNQRINDILRRGKWLMFKLDDYYLLSHLRMEGRYYFKTTEDITKHEHIVFNFDNYNLRYVDTRKFGRMYLLPKEDVFNKKPLSELGFEPWDEKLTSDYLEEKYKNKKLPIKTVLLDQSIITGIGNIYADEILFMSKINPYKKCSTLKKKELDKIINNTRIILEKAIGLGGTTIRTYESSKGVHGRFQNELLVHNKEICSDCSNKLNKEFIGGRSTYYCNKCQKM